MVDTVTCFLPRLTLLNKLLEDGNTLYRRGRHEEAAHRYAYAIRRLPARGGGCGGGGGEKEDKDHGQVFDQLRVHLLLNLSRCRRKQGQPAEAAARAAEVLAFRPDCLEALHARARAYR